MHIYRFTAIALCVAISVSADERVDRLSDEHRKWLEQEVVYIITEPEREAFLSIDTLEPRDRFIEAFWIKRDPDRATAENEFRTEHYRRLAHANEYLGRETSIPGWKTDRGRYYIILGEPRSIQAFDGYQELVSIELWLYQGNTQFGLPPFFNLMFFKPRDVGAYRLYRPLTDGPHALLQSTFDIGIDAGPAVQIIYRASHELARASLSFDASETVDFVNARPSLTSDVVMARIEELPSRMVRASYADAFLRYGDRVSTEYSFNFIPSRTVSSVLHGPDDSAFVHFAIEIAAEDFSVETNEDQSRFYTTLDMDIEVRERSTGQPVLAEYRELGIEMTPAQFEQVRRSPYSVQDGFGLVPGSYHVSVTLRNRVQTRFTVAEWNVDVSSPSAGPGLSDLVLGYELEREENDPSRGRPFRVGHDRINPAQDHTFAIHETLHALIQVRGIEPDTSGYTTRFTLLDSDTVLESHDSVITSSHEGAIIQSFPLLGTNSGSYRLRAELVDPSGETVAERSTEVQVSPRTAIPRPSFIYRRRFDTSRGAIALAEGEQLWKLGRADQAQRRLEKAAAENDPFLPAAHWQLAALLLGTGETERALELLAPLENDHPDTFEVIAGLGLAHYFEKDFAAAVGRLEHAVTLRPPDPPLLNALGDTYQQLGTLDKARATYERSLRLEPNQAAIQKRLDSLQKNDTAK